MSALSIVNVLFAGGVVALIAKVTVLLGAAALATVLLRNISAATRHLIWFVALGGCLLLPMATALAPRWAVAVPTPREEPNVRAPAVYVPVRVATTTTTRYIGQRSPITTRRSTTTEVIAISGSGFQWMPLLSQLLFGGWILGCVFVLGRCGIGHLAVTRIVNRAHEAESYEFEGALATAARDVGLTRDVRLLVSDDISAPITSGVVNPVVIVPTDAYNWSAERLHIVLVHELAHVVRFDYFAQLVATFATALFWFHPLVWFANSRLRSEAEHAADDQVLASGTTGVNYATHLLELARAESGLHLSAAVAVGMVRSSRLEGRFRAMLDHTRSRAAVSTRAQVAAIVAIVAGLIPLAGLRTIAYASPSPSRSDFVRASASASPSASVSVSPAFAYVTTVAGSQTVATTAPLQAAATVASSADSTILKSVDAAPGERLILQLETGGNIIVRGWDEPRVQMRALLGGRDWRDTRVSLERSGSTVRLRSDFSHSADNRSTQHTFELRVPRHTDIEVSSSGGMIAINDLSGEFRGHSGGGGIVIHGATGYASLTTGGGEVRVSDSNLRGTVGTGGGAVTISNVSGGLAGYSGAGPVVTTAGVGSTAASSTINAAGGGVTVTSGYAYTTTNTNPSYATTANGRALVSQGSGSFSLAKAGGDIVLDEAPYGAVVSTGGGRVFIGEANKLIRATTGGGDIELPRLSGNAIVHTGSGDVTIGVVNVEGREHSIDVYSGNGRVVLELPADLDATIELETAYTDNNRRGATFIETDFPLERSETSVWDDRFGTPRKFVRARGTVGTGRGLIKVRTVNGDIVIRRR
jgi:beta-lactamase regulating signal transducer with metallopeptidase domain